ncbi:acetyl-CoA carboxylase biotin carboxyl carrier protein [Carnobacterium jeotgali]|uniref:acetyl-CoA carboxylase biotin carboxyl carrier protein n=1 Tax=Carnobacterium jeotgali TaxID=545534 RepID=UPI00388D4667
MDFSQVKEILDLVNKSELTEFDLQMDNVNLRMSKNISTQQISNQPVATNSEARFSEPVRKENLQASSPIFEEAAPIAESIAEGALVHSPIVGVIYTSPSPDQPAFKKVGDKVTVGETLCIVEAMKLMNEIKSEIDGTITEILIEDEQVVEFNQPLFRIA